MTQVQLPPVYRDPEIADVKAESLPWHITDVELETYWELTGGGEGIVVAVLDTGIDADHPDIAGRIDATEVFVTNWRGVPESISDRNHHGTHVATTTAVMSPNCRFIIGKVLGDNGTGSNAGVAEGIHWAADSGAHIINLSLGSPYDDPQTRDAIRYAKSKGCIVLCATGNEAANAVGFPAQHAVGVGAIDRGRKLAWFSNRGKEVDLVGYGVNIVAGIPGGRYQAMSGTSMATPWIAGIAANRLSAELKHLGQIVTNSDDNLRKLDTFVTDLGPEGQDTSYGRGMPDLEKCLKIAVAEPPGEEPIDAPTVQVDLVDDRGNEWHGFLTKVAIAIACVAAMVVGAQRAQAENTLHCLNAQRATFGLFPLQPSPRLQQVAESGAYQRSLRDMNGHLYGGRPMAGRWEGTAKRRAYHRGPAGEFWGAEDVYACYQNHRTARYAGCASVYNPRTRSWYYQINLDTRP